MVRVRENCFEVALQNPSAMAQMQKTKRAINRQRRDEQGRRRPQVLGQEERRVVGVVDAVVDIPPVVAT